MSAPGRETLVDGLFAAIDSLAMQPQRFGLTPESPEFAYEIRQMPNGRKRNHRIVYAIDEKVVSVLAVRHAAQDALDPDEF
jgi:plasmid stabilization system protein ParE